MALDLATLKASLESQNVDVLRVLYADVLGVTRSKDLLVSQLEHSAHNGPAFSQGVWVTTTVGGFHDAAGIASDGLPDFVCRIDPTTVREVPWEPGIAYAIADALNPDGTPNLFSPREVLRKIIGEYNELGLQPVVGPELEFYLAERGEDGNWQRGHEHVGMVYTTGQLVDPDGTFLHILRMVDQLGIDVFAGNHEFSPSQYEINIWHGEALWAADRTFYLKSAIKDIAWKAGKLATFVGKPWSDEGGSGFHLHFSVTDMDGVNKMHDAAGELTDTAKAIIGGITHNADGLLALTNPTINAFRRLGPDTLAPYRANWGYDNRSCMVRVPPERGQGTRLEIRVGDGAANPYLLIAGILAAGLDGLRRQLDCPADAVGMAYDNEDAPVLPATFADALAALEVNEKLRGEMSHELFEAFLVLKRDELERFNEAVPEGLAGPVSDWERTEYFIHY